MTEEAVQKRQKDRKACPRRVSQKLKQKISVKSTPGIEPGSTVSVGKHSTTTPPPMPNSHLERKRDFSRYLALQEPNS